MSAQHHQPRQSGHASLRRQIETAWALGRSGAQIVADLGCNPATVKRYITLIRDAGARPEIAGEDERHVADVFAAQPGGFYAKHLPATYRVRA